MSGDGYGYSRDLAMDNGHKWGLELNSVLLQEAVLCADCEIISNSAGESCQICGSRSLLCLGRVLGGCIEGERAVLVQWDHHPVHNGFTVLVNPEADGVLQQRRRRKISG
jgi:hypothetical protein